MAASPPPPLPRAPYRCHVRGQLCDLRIASGSVVNFVSGSLVRNLNLGITPHPSPYNADCCVGTGPSVRITTQSRVLITIGEYQEEVLCDVMEELAIADILLGFPWIISKEGLSIGREFAFDHNGARIVIAPEPTNVPDPENVAVITAISKVFV